MRNGTTLFLLFYYHIGHRSRALIVVMANIPRKFMVCKLLKPGYIVCRLNELTGQLEQVSNVLLDEAMAQEDASFRNDISETSI